MKDASVQMVGSICLSLFRIVRKSLEFGIALLCVLAGSGFDAWADVGAPKRVALVIGNSDYDNLTSLKSPKNDALLISETLQSIGFELVTTIVDADLNELQERLVEFQHVAENADLVLVYFSGHGLEYRGENYLLPVDAFIDDFSGLEQTALNLEVVFDTVRRTKNTRLVILDACRSSPFLDEEAVNAPRPADLNRSSGTKGLGRVGLSPVDGVSDIVVAFAAKSGTEAYDGTGPYSPYAEALSKRLKTPGVDVRRLLGLVRDDVMRSTSMAQEPFVYGSVGGNDIYMSTGFTRRVPQFRPDEWVALNGPYYGGVDSIAFVPGDDQKIWATRRGKTYRSVDAGKNWFPAGKLGPEAYARTFAINPLQPERVFAAAGAGVYRREVDGTWSSSDYFPEGKDNVTNGIAIAPDEPDLILVASSITPRIGVGASSGTGASVVTRITDPSQEGRPLNLIWSESEVGGYVHRSLNGGASWTTSNMPYSLSVAISSGRQPVMFVGTADMGVLASHDAGKSWRQFQCIYARYRADAISIDPANPKRATIATSEGAFLLNLEAEEPCQQVLPTRGQKITAVLMSRNGDILVGTADGLFVSSDSGSTFVLQENVLRGRRIFRLAEGSSGRQVASLDIDGVAVRKDPQSSWEIGFEGFDTLGAGAFGSDNADRIFVGGVGLWQTENSGSSFEKIHSGSQISAVEFVPAILNDETPDRSWGQKGTLLIGTSKGEVLRSIDGGASWRLVMNSPMDGRRGVSPFIRAIAHLGEGKVLAAAAGSLYSSDDLGRTWSRVSAFPGEELVSAVGAVDTNTQSALIGTVSGKVLKCARACDEIQIYGDSQALRGPVTWILKSVHDASTWILIEGDLVYRLEEGKWTARSVGIEEPVGFAIAEDPKVPGRLFVSTTNSVFASEDNGEAWERITAGGPQLSEVQALFVDPRSMVLFASDRIKILGLRLSE